MEIGDLIGDYKILEKKDQGNMGVVYKAEDTKSGLEVALKLMLSSNPTDTQVERFKREAEAARKVSHRNVVKVYNSGEVNGQHFIAMQWVKGDSLEKKMNSLSPKQKLVVIEKVAEALGNLHSQGVVHRDLKPANIIIDQENEPVVIDLGIAKLANAEYNLTMADKTMGTPAYMSPEQVEHCNKVEPPADIFSLGCLMYQLLTDKLPFLGDDAFNVMRSIVDKEPTPIREIKPSIDVMLEKICMKAMAKNPGDRYKTMEDFAAAIKGYLEITTSDENILNTLIQTGRISKAVHTLDDFDITKLKADKTDSSTASATATPKTQYVKPIWAPNVKRAWKVIETVLKRAEISEKVSETLLTCKKEYIDIFDKLVSSKDKVRSKALKSEDPYPDYSDLFKQLNARFGEEIWKPVRSGSSAINLIVDRGESKLKTPILDYRPFMLFSIAELRKMVDSEEFRKVFDSLYIRDREEADIAVIDLYCGVIYLGNKLPVTEHKEMLKSNPHDQVPHSIPSSLDFSLRFESQVTDVPLCHKIERDEKNHQSNMYAQIGKDHQLQFVGVIRDVYFHSLLNHKGTKGKELIYFPQWIIPVTSTRGFKAFKDEVEKVEILRNGLLGKVMSKKHTERRYVAEYTAEVETTGDIVYSGIWGDRVNAHIFDSKVMGEPVKTENPSAKSASELEHQAKDLVKHFI